MLLKFSVAEVVRAARLFGRVRAVQGMRRTASASKPTIMQNNVVFRPKSHLLYRPGPVVYRQQRIGDGRRAMRMRLAVPCSLSG